MSNFRKSRLAMSVLSAWAMVVYNLSCATEMEKPDITLSETLSAAHAQAHVALAVFENDETGMDASAAEEPTLDTPGAFHDQVAVNSAALEDMRGGFDLAPGLKVSFGIERIVNLNGALQTATRIEVPDVAKLIQAQHSAGSAALPPGVALTATSQPVSIPNGNHKAGESTPSPVLANLGGGAAALIQNSVGSMVTAGQVSPEAAATFIQNSANNQTIQSLTVINAATNSLELLKGANLQSTLLDALSESARAR